MRVGGVYPSLANAPCPVSPPAEDVFPCKDCGIWYRSERNLQAHLMYYCASRQSSASPAADEKPKETYPNERVCPFPQCKKSCPSASSLEIHMRSHSGTGQGVAVPRCSFWCIFSICSSPPPCQDPVPTSLVPGWLDLLHVAALGTRMS